jgi:histidine triad (HIT) family protein
LQIPEISGVYQVKFVMHSHAPENYDCPFCKVASNDFSSEAVHTKTQDIILRTPLATAFIASGWWPNNAGHILVIPNKHFENIYDLPKEVAAEVHGLAQKVALAFKAVYKCDGISTRQHNEPAGNQDVWHYHLHVFPRYQDDELYTLFWKRELIPTPINSLTSYVGWAPAHLCKPRCKRLLFQSSRFGGQEPTLRKINLLFGVGITTPEQRLPYAQKLRDYFSRI